MHCSGARLKGRRLFLFVSCLGASLGRPGVLSPFLASFSEPRPRSCAPRPREFPERGVGERSRKMTLGDLRFSRSLFLLLLLLPLPALCLSLVLEKASLAGEGSFYSVNIN